MQISPAFSISREIRWDDYSLASRPDICSIRIRKKTCGSLSAVKGTMGLSAPGSHQSACLLSTDQA